jgi:murein DD-endopeptidase MepM/ murein hydrolase activator NlpD
MRNTSFTLLSIGALVALSACTTVSHTPAPVDIRPYQAAQQPVSSDSVYWAGEGQQTGARTVQPQDYLRPAQPQNVQIAASGSSPLQPGTVVSRRIIREGDYLPQLEVGGDDPEPTVTYRFPAEEQRQIPAPEPLTPYSPEYRWSPYHEGDDRGGFVAANPLSADAASLAAGSLAGAPKAQPVPVTGPPQPAGATAGAPGWAHTQAVGPQMSSAITVRQGDTLYSLAQRHRVPLATLMQANNLSDGAIIKIGQSLVVPGNHSITVQPGDTLFGIGRRYSIDPRSLAIFNGLSAPYTLQPGQLIHVPAMIAETPQFKQAVLAGTETQSAGGSGQSQLASSRGPVTLKPQTTSPAIMAAPLVDGFVWPVSGAVVEGFGAIGQGRQNDGINIAVPVGTDVRAAKDGVVSYVGDEIRSYGRLILVTHPDGFVTAYAHLSEYLVKEEAIVKAGQVIARSGQTGIVGSPQLHFEIRQRGVPLNPLTKLANRNS